MLPVDEAERAAEQLLGPYTADEHSKRRVVVREARLNRAYVDPALQPAERADPDAGKKKRVRGPEELEAGGPIRAVPLRAVGVGVAGEVAVGAPGPPPRKTSRVSAGPLEAVVSASSSAASLAVSPRAGVGQVAAGSFAIASLALDEESGGTPSHVYGRGTEDTRVEDRVDGAGTGAFGLVYRASSRLPWLITLFCWVGVQRESPRGLGRAKRSPVDFPRPSSAEARPRDLRGWTKLVALPRRGVSPMWAGYALWISKLVPLCPRSARKWVTSPPRRACRGCSRGCP